MTVIGSKTEQSTIKWATPWPLFRRLNSEFHFTLDPAASPDNAKCEKYFTIDDDGLAQSWAGHRVFCNPPYGNECPDWVEKGVREMKENGVFSVFLIVPRTDTKWFHSLCSQATEIRLLKGRVAFVDEHGRNRPQDPNIVVVFDPAEQLITPRFTFWDWKPEAAQFALAA